MTDHNQLGEEGVGRLLTKFAVPSIIAMLVSSLYNIVDQFFIGRSVGELGNAATNIAFPLTISCVAATLLFSIGGASAFNISMGKASFDDAEREKAPHYMGTALTMMVVCGLVLTLISRLFLEPMLRFFGSPENVLDYAKTYTRIVSLGFPLLILSGGGGNMLRADGSPNLTMACNITGAVLNTGLDALFVFGFGWGIAGAAWATVLGQAVACALAVYYLAHTKTVRLRAQHFVPSAALVKRIAALGAAPCTNQISMMVVQIVMNKSLKYYGSLSIYGEAVPIACAGIITKVNQLYMAFVIGTSQAQQPIASYNYGARRYGRVKQVYAYSMVFGAAVSAVAFCLFHFAPRQIISVFGNGSEEYYQFAIRYFKVYLFFTFLNFIQPLSSNFFTAIGKPTRGMVLSLTRQIIFLLPLLVVFPLFMGIDGIMYAGPVADFAAALVCGLLIARELHRPEYRGGDAA